MPGSSVQASNRLAEGDLTVVIESNSKDETGQLLAAMQNMVGKLKEVVNDVRSASDNVAAGSQFPVGSRHVWGKALDLVVPNPTATLWARLRSAGANAGNSSICEVGPTQVPCNNANVNHVHIQW